MNKKNLAVLLSAVLTAQNAIQPLTVLAEEEESDLSSQNADTQDVIETDSEEETLAAEEEVVIEEPEEEVTEEEPEVVIPAISGMSTAGTFSVSTNLPSGSAALPLGKISDAVQSLDTEGYEFKGAFIGSLEIDQVCSWENNLYFSVAGSEEAVKLNTEVTLLFEELPKEEEEEPETPEGPAEEPEAPAEEPAAQEPAEVAEEPEVKDEDPAEEEPSEETEEEQEEETEIPEEEDEDPEEKDEDPEEEDILQWYAVRFFDQSLVDGELKVDEQPSIVQYVKEGETAVTPSANSIAGYAFEGWKSEGKSITDPVSGNVDFIASYKKIADTVTLSIYYHFNNDEEGTTTAAQPFIAEVPSGAFSETITFPSIYNCTPKVKDDEGNYVEMTSWTFNNPTKDVEVHVYYEGKEAQYTVVHQFLKSDGKTVRRSETETLTGEYNNPTEAAAKSVDGYIAQGFSQTTIKNDTVVYIRYLPKEYQISYETGCDSYIAPVSVYVDEDLPSVDTDSLIHPGYTFSNWQYVVNGETVTNLDAMPAGDVTAKAVWTANTKAAYKIVFWQEKVDQENVADEDLVFEMAPASDIVTGTGTPGENIPVNLNTYANKYSGFSLDTARSSGDVEILQDGTAVKNIYFVRNSYTINFKVKKSGKWTVESSITAKYGSNINSQWNAIAQNYDWSTTTNGSTYYTTVFTMPLNGFDCYRRGSINGLRTIKYYVETFESGKYTTYATAKCDSDVTSLTLEDAMPIEGFTFIGDTSNSTKFNSGKGTAWNYSSSSISGQGTDDSGQRYTGGWLKYSRNSYSLCFENCSGLSTAMVKYQASINDSIPKAADGSYASPDRPANVEKDYVFAGWYTSPNCADGTEFDPSTTMPSHTVTLYAKWVKPSYTVTYETNKEGYSVDPVTLEKGKEIPAASLDGSEFLGWYTDPEFKHKLIDGSKIGSDITLYARWKDSTVHVSYTIRMVDTDGEIITDDIVVEDDINPDEEYVINAPEVPGYEAINDSITTMLFNGEVIEFMYREVSDWSYTVRYVDEDGKEIASDKVVSSTSLDIVTENYVAIDGYKLADNEDAQKTLAKTSSDHMITFRYECLNAAWTIEYVVEKADGSKELIDTVSGTGRIGSVVEADKSINPGPGYHTDSSMTLTIKKGGSKLTVLYVPNVHTVTYKFADDVSALNYTGSLPEAKSVKYGASETVMDDLSAEGYIFSGWTTGDVTVTDGSFSMPDGDVVFTGSFTRDTDSLKLETKNLAWTYDKHSEGFVVEGILPVETVVVKDSNKEQVSNAFVNVADSGSYSVFVYNMITGDYYDVDDGTVTISKRPVTLISAEANKEYDGQWFNNEEINLAAYGPESLEIIEGDLAADSLIASLDFKERTEGVVPDTYWNTFTVNLAEGMKDNYELSCQPGKLLIKKNTTPVVTPKGDNNLKLDDKGKNLTKVYDGEESTISASVEATINGEKIDVTGDYTFTYTVDGQPVEGEPKFINACNHEVVITAVSDLYETRTITVTVNISKRPVVLTTHDHEFVYDGTDHSCQNCDKVDPWTLTGMEDIPETASVHFEKTVKNVGDKETNEAKLTVMRGDYDSTANYEVETHFGTITVKAASADLLGLKAEDKTVVYNGEHQQLNAAMVTVTEGTVIEYSRDGETWSTTIPGYKDVGEYDVQIRAVNPNYQTKTATATLTIEQAELKIVTQKAEKTYDGTPMTAPGSIEGIMDSDKDKVDFTVTGTLTDVGEVPNSYALTFADEKTKANYKVSESVGMLKVTPADSDELGLMLNAKTVTYNGGNQSLDPASVSVEEGTKIEYSVDGLTWSEDMPEFKDVESYMVYARAVNKNYETAKAQAVLTINQAVLTVVTNDASKVYDGTPLKGTGSIDGIQGEDEITFEVTGTITNVGETKNTYTLTFGEGVDENNYDLRASVGTLKVTEASADLLGLKAEDKTVTYNAQNQSIDAATVTVTEGTTVEYSADGQTWSTDLPEFKDVGKYDIYVRAVNPNYFTKDAQVKLTIKKAQLSVVTESDEKVYDGTPLTAPGSVTGAQGDEVIECVTTGSITNVGETDNTYELAYSSGAKESNYEVTKEEIGILEVTKAAAADLGLKAEDKNTVYNADNQTIDAATVTVTEGTVIEYSTDKETWSTELPEFKDAKEYMIYIQASNDNYYTADTTAKLTIAKAPLIVVTESATKLYDGTPLTAGGSVTGVQGDEVIECVTKGEITNVGTERNTYELAYSNGAKESNYEVAEETIGLLEVTKADASLLGLEAQDKTVTYNGYNQTIEKAAVSIEAGTTILYSADGKSWSEELPEFKDAGKYDIYVQAVNDNYNTADDKVILTIEQAVLTVTTPDASKVYDGTPLTAEGTISGIQGEDVITMETTGTITNVGETDNTYVLTYGEGVKESNYRVEESVGTLSVTKADARELGLKAEDKTVVYNGEGQSIDPAEVNVTEGTVVEYSADFENWSTELPQFKDAGEYDVYVRAVNDNYFTAGDQVTLTIEKAELKVTTDSASKKYDGTELTAPASIEGVQGEDVIEVKATGSITNVGEVKNTYEITYGEGTLESNYFITEEFGTLKVERADDVTPILIPSEDGKSDLGDDEKVYDGINYDLAPCVLWTNAEGEEVNIVDEYELYYTVTLDGEAYYEGYGLPELIDSGVYAIAVTGTADNFGDVEMSGTVTINKRQLVITTHDHEWVYDGTEHQCDKDLAVTIEGHGAADKETVHIEMNSTIKNVGEVANEVTVEVRKENPTVMGAIRRAIGLYDGGNGDAKAHTERNYEITFASIGTLKVTPAVLTVTTESATKVYDGTPLTAGGKIAGAIDGDAVELKVTGSQTKVGSSVNTYEIVWNDADASNYTIVEELGTLTVTAKAETPSKTTPTRTTTTKATTTSSVKTSAAANPGLWAGLMGAAAAAMGAGSKHSRKGRNKKK